MLWNKQIIYEYLKPMYQKLVVNMLEMLGEHVETYEQDNQEGAYTILDHQMEDYFPL